MTDELQKKLCEATDKVEADAWDLVVSTDACDREAAESAIRLIYSEQGAIPPSSYIWCASPSEAGELLKADIDFGESLINKLWLYPRVRASRMLYVMSEGDLDEVLAFVAYRSKLGRLRESLMRFAPTPAFGYGCHDAPWLLAITYIRAALGLPNKPELIGLTALTRAGGWFAPFGNACLMMERPKAVRTVEKGLLHCENGPALSWRNGTAHFYLHGIEVPSKAVLLPESLTCTDICNSTNAEVRRVLLDIFGLERFMAETNTKTIHQDEFGQLLKLDLPELSDSIFMDPLVIRVTNATPKPDGSYKIYLLSVPWDIKTAKQAVAWTFGKMEGEYHPTIET